GGAWGVSRPPWRQSGSPVALPGPVGCGRHIGFIPFGSRPARTVSQALGKTSPCTSRSPAAARHGRICLGRRCDGGLLGLAWVRRRGRPLREAAVSVDSAPGHAPDAAMPPSPATLAAVVLARPAPVTLVGPARG